MSCVPPEPNVFGWYARQIVVPAAYKGLDLFLDLGLIDDADVTYVNGKEVGRKGDLNNKVLSAWNVHRRYVCPSEVVRFGQPNTVAVQVKNFTGLGGLLGQPWIGASLVASRKARFAEGDLPVGEASQAGFDDTKWAEIPLPDEEWAKRIPKRPAYGWYRIRLDLPESLAGLDLLLDLGMVYDAAAAYLNGKLIGQCGRFPPDFFPQTAGRFRSIAPANVIQPKGNVLAIRVYNEDQFGVIVGLPSVDFELTKPIGRQDQYAVAYGGLNYMRFNPDGSVHVEPVPCKRETIAELERRSLLLYTNDRRDADAILAQQSEGTSDRMSVLRQMRDLADTMRHTLAGRGDLDEFARLLHVGWELKRSLGFGISNPKVDGWYDAARRAGARGGKLLGAGGGGFLFVLAPPERHEAIRETLGNPITLPLLADPLGSRIIFISDRH